MEPEIDHFVGVEDQPFLAGGNDGGEVSSSKPGDVPSVTSNEEFIHSPIHYYPAAGEVVSTATLSSYVDSLESTFEASEGTNSSGQQTGFRHQSSSRRARQNNRPRVPERIRRAETTGYFCSI